MHRLKLIALLLFVVAGLSLASFMVVRNDFGPRIEKSLAEDLAKTQMAVQAIKLARARRLGTLADWLARHPELNLAHALSGASEEVRQKQAFEGVEAIKPLLQKAGRQSYAPDVTLLLDPSGKILARDRFKTPGTAEPLKFPLIARVVRDKARDQDIWRYREQNERMMTAVAAPIFDGTNVVGVLALLYDWGNQMAQDDKAVYKTDVAYFHQDTVYGSSLADHAHVKSLRAFIAPHQSALQEGKMVGPSVLKIGGKRYLALAATFESDASDKGGGFILAASLADALAPVSAFLTRFPFIAAGFLLVSILLGLFLLRSVAAPYERIEHGIMEMVSGNLEHRFDQNLPGNAGALAQALNLLVAQLQGRPPPDREVEDHSWDALMIENAEAVAEAAAAHKGDIDTQAGGLTYGYYQKLFDAYVAARKSVGDQGTVAFGGFTDKVRKNEEALRKRLKCTAVKFDVLVKDGRVVLKPVPIK